MNSVDESVFIGLKCRVNSRLGYNQYITKALFKKYGKLISLKIINPKTIVL